MAEPIGYQQGVTKFKCDHFAYFCPPAQAKILDYDCPGCRFSASTKWIPEDNPKVKYHPEDMVDSLDDFTMIDLKPIGQKAPLNLLPAAPLRAISAAMEHGAIKYAPWNFQDTSQPQARIAELYAALLRHTLAASDPSQPDLDTESGLHHIAHAGACVLLLLYKLGIDYTPSKLVKHE